MNFDLENLSSFAGWERLAETGMAFGTNLVAALAIFFVGRWIAARLVILMKAALTRAKVDRTLVSFLGNVANVGLLILIIIAAGFVAERPTVELCRRRVDYSVPSV